MKRRKAGVRRKSLAPFLIELSRRICYNIVNKAKAKRGSSMSVPVQIESIIKRLATKNIMFIQPIYEAIANSLEANATDIEVEIFHEDTLSLEDENLMPKITGFKITDNGDGFTDTNRKAFNEFWTANKAKLGCKGSGRFLWLTVFDDIDIYSEVLNENVSVTIPFNKKFSEDVIKVKEKELIENKTILEFKNVTERFFNPDKKLDHRYPADLGKVCESVKEYLLIKLFLLKNKNILFNIRFKMDKQEKSICNNDVPDLLHENFTIHSDLVNTDYLFTLYYHFFEDNRNWKKGFYCANDRAAQKMDDNDLGFSGGLPNRASFSILVCSDYFNDKDDDSRNELSALKGNKDRGWDIPLLFSDIRPAMQKKMKEIIKDKFPQIDELNKEAVEEAINIAPHLASIIKADDDIVKTKDSLIKKAKVIFAEKKESAQSKFSKFLSDKSIDENAFMEAVAEISDVAAAELGEYILYRENIIKALERAISDTSTNEAFIHNIIMEMRTTSTKSDDSYLLNNLWLLDDKFMTYSYAASDMTIKKIMDDIAQNDEKYKASNRPDLSIFFNRDERVKDLVMVELKGPNADKNEKNKAITELNNNIGIVRTNIKNVDSVWSYIITSIDDDFDETVRNADFNELFCNDNHAKIYYRYYKNLNAHVYVLDLNAIVADAFARNKTFLDILKKK